MAAFGSYLPSSSPLVVDHLIICVADALISILAGMTVYTSLGNLAHSRGTSIQEEGASAGIGLAFVTYPQSLATLPPHVGKWPSLLLSASDTASVLCTLESSPFWRTNSTRGSLLGELAAKHPPPQWA